MPRGFRLISQGERYENDTRTSAVQNVLEWANLPVSDDDYYRDLAVSLQMAGNNHRRLTYER